MTGALARQAFYAVAALTGLVLTWYFNLRYSGSAGYLADWFANDASSSAAVDLLVVAAAASVFIVVESRRLEIPLWQALGFVLAGFVLAMAFAFPLFLLYRERRLAATRRPGPDPVGGRDRAAGQRP